MPISEETRKQIFDKLRHGLAKCTPPMVIARETPGNLSIEMIGNTPVPYGHDKKMIPGMYFASVAQRKDSVAFYFFPSYGADLESLAPTLYKNLKGKTCFHFKKPEQVNEKELDALLKKGVEIWQDQGYMK
jgi:hypothetical protein